MIVFLAISLGVSMTACDNQTEKAQAPALPQEKSASSAPAATQKDIVITGKAKEVLSGGGFTYILVDADKAETWVVVPETEVAVGEEVKVKDGEMMHNFPSKALDRTFAEVVFSSGLEGKAAKSVHHGGMGSTATASPHGAMDGSSDDFAAAMADESGGSMVDPSVQAMGSSKAVVPFQDLSIAKIEGENGYNVSEIFAKAAELNGKTIRIKGQVVKFSPNIMGKNWLHIQDGTGEPMNNTHDLVVTSSEQAEKGDIVVVEGVLAANKDFGFGYRYDVLIEDAKVNKQ
jgi:hypothetical protein